MTTTKELDKFYTRPEVANRLIDTACGVLGVNRDSQTFLEPSAGAGAFSSKIPNVLAYDLLPENADIVQADFLLLEPTWEKSSTVTIGNPPFGRRAKLAIQFVNRAASHTDAVCFVLPNTFRRYNVQSALDDDLALVLDEDLDEHNSFTFEGNPYSLRCVFQIWVRKDGAYWREDMKDLRLRKRPPVFHADFECWQHNATEQSRKYLDEDWKYAFWRQGYKDYGRVFTKADDYDEVKKIMYETNLQLFFVKPLNDEAEEIILAMDKEALAKQNLSTPGFGKADFVSEYTRLKSERKHV